MAKRVVQRNFKAAQIFPSLGLLVRELFHLAPSDTILDWGSKNAEGAIQTYSYLAGSTIQSFEMDAFVDDDCIEPTEIPSLRLIPNRCFRSCLREGAEGRTCLFVHALMTQSLVEISSHVDREEGSLEPFEMPGNESRLHYSSRLAQPTPSSPSSAFVMQLLLELQSHRNIEAIVVTGDEVLFEDRWARVREDLIESGCLDAVVLLPDRLVRSPFTSRHTCLLKLGRQHTDFSFFDARPLGSVPYTRANERSLTRSQIMRMVASIESSDTRIPYSFVNESPFLLNYSHLSRFYFQSHMVPNCLGLGSEMVQGADWYPLHELICDSRRGYALPRHVRLSREMTHARYVSIADFSYGSLVDSDKDSYLVDEEGWTSRALDSGDVVIARVGRGSNACCVTQSMVEQACLVPSQNLLVVRPDRVDPEYLAVFLSSNVGKGLVDSFRGGSLGALSLKSLEMLPIPVPNPSVQDRFVAKAHEYYKTIREAEQSIARATQFLEELFGKGEF